MQTNKICPVEVDTRLPEPKAQRTTEKVKTNFKVTSSLFEETSSLGFFLKQT